MGIIGASVVARIGDEVDKKGLKRTDLYKIVPSATLSNWKNQGHGPSAYTLYEVSVFLDVSVDYLLTGKTPDGLSQDEQNLVAAYRNLDTKDKEEIMGIIDLKFNISKKGDTISSSTNA